MVVEDGAIVELGGLLTDEFSGGEEKVPILGDVPIFGNLFKGQSRTRKKSNLMVFLRPVVVRDASSTERLSQDRYDFMRSAQQQGQPIPNVMVPINSAPVLPPLRDSRRETVLPNMPNPLIPLAPQLPPIQPRVMPSDVPPPSLN